MPIGRICRREVHLADPEESAYQAARRMRDRGVGTLIVCDAAGIPVGILSDRDLCARVLAEGLDGRSVRVEEVMTRDPVRVTEETPIEDALRYMRAHQVRRLPVTDTRDELVGIVSLDDVVGLLAEEMRQIGALVESQEPPVGLHATNRPPGA